MLMLEGKEMKTQEPSWTRALEVWGWSGELSAPWGRPAPWRRQEAELGEAEATVLQTEARRVGGPAPDPTAAPLRPGPAGRDTPGPSGVGTSHSPALHPAHVTIRAPQEGLLTSPPSTSSDTRAPRGRNCRTRLQNLSPSERSGPGKEPRLPGPCPRELSGTPRRVTSAGANHSEVTEFIPVGLPGSLGLHVCPLVVPLLAYLLPVTESLLAVAQLSFLEVRYISVTVPKMPLSLAAPEFCRISFAGCMVQLYFFLALACSGCALLGVMAYDRHVAICSLRRYPAIVSPGLCSLLAAGPWLSGFTTSTGKVFFIPRLGYCGPNVMNHFFCDVSPLLNLACSDVSLAELVDFLLALLMLLGPLPLTRTLSAAGRHEAFSTCASHLAVVVVFYSASLFIYARPHAIYSFDLHKLVPVVHTVLTPLLNPIICCLRKREVKEALHTVVQRAAQALGTSS
ncbi:hypothetical protein J1605_015131 [Eschrichtius robustus]|uniref:G-protein coupled receptors family 1 profile domain-containing protein n=1 Tax=Eschrichtius robustus TaxID=9764 RepID=A0AB34GD71_ESCRO|nr:hypothetical protein J1605_015131 [Eschrichtius robustus]